MAETSHRGSGMSRSGGRFPRLGGATWSFSVAWELAERRAGACLVVGRRAGMARTRWLAAQYPFEEVQS